MKIKNQGILLFYFLALQIFLVQPLLAQRTTTISGTIIDEATLETIPFANIRLKSIVSENDLNIQTSDINGEFKINVNQPGKYVLIISYLGYENSSFEIIIKKRIATHIGTIKLKSSHINLKEVALEAESPTLVQKPGKTILNVNDPMGADGENAIQLLKYLPSVSIDANNNVLMRGAPVTILIDGIETDLDNALESLPVGIIDNIELITNPSAKYSSRAGGGVVNIVLKKKSKIFGVNGKVHFGLGTPERIQGGGNLMFKKGKLTSITDLNLNHYTDRTINTSGRQNIIPNRNFMTGSGTSDKKYNDYIVSQNFRYQLTNNSLISLNATYRNYKYSYDSFNDSKWFYPDSKIYSYSDNKMTGRNDKQFYNAMATYKKDFSKKSNLEIVAKHEGQKNLSPFDRTILYYDLVTNNYKKNYNFQTQTLPEKIQSNRLQVDFEQNTANGLKFESGFLLLLRNSQAANDFTKYSYRYSESTANYSTTIDSSAIYQFTVNEINPAIYTVFSKEIKKFSISAGLRYEYSYLSPKSARIDSVIVNNYYNFLPSLAMQQKVNKNFTLGFSYSKRTKLPTYTQLNPVMIYSGQNYKSGGNPYLQPEKITNIEFYAKNTMGIHTFNTALFYKYFEDIIDRGYTTVVEDGNDVMVSKFANLGLSKQLGSEITLSSKLPYKITTKLNLMAYKQFLKNEIYGSPVSETDFVYSGKITVEQFLGNNFRWILNSNYFSPIPNMNNIKKEFYFVDLSLMQLFYKKKLTVSLQAYDLFNSLKTVSNSFSPNFESSTLSKNITQRFLLSANYKLNTMKAAKSKK